MRVPTVLHLCTFAGGIANFLLLSYCAHRASAETVWMIAPFPAVAILTLVFLSVGRDQKLALLELAGELGKVGVAVTQARGGLFGGGFGFGTAPMPPMNPDQPPVEVDPSK